MDIRPKRHWFRYSLRTLLVIVTVCSALFGWLGIKVRQAQRQKDAVEAIRELHWDVKYDYEYDPNATRFVPPTPPGPAWVRNSFGVDFLANVVYVDFLSDGVTDAGLDYLEGLNQLKYLHLKNANITDAGLVRIQGLTQLEFLTLSRTRVTDAGLVYLKGLTHLEYLYLEQTHVTDAGCQKLRKALPKLKIIR